MWCTFSAFSQEWNFAVSNFYSLWGLCSWGCMIPRQIVICIYQRDAVGQVNINCQKFITRKRKKLLGYLCCGSIIFPKWHKDCIAFQAQLHDFQFVTLQYSSETTRYLIQKVDGIFQRRLLHRNVMLSSGICGHLTRCVRYLAHEEHQQMASVSLITVADFTRINAILPMRTCSRPVRNTINGTKLWKLCPHPPTIIFHNPTVT